MTWVVTAFYSKNFKVVAGLGPKNVINLLVTEDLEVDEALADAGEEAGQRRVQRVDQDEREDAVADAELAQHVHLSGKKANLRELLVGRIYFKEIVGRSPF